MNTSEKIAEARKEADVVIAKAMKSYSPNDARTWDAVHEARIKASKIYFEKLGEKSE